MDRLTRAWTPPGGRQRLGKIPSRLGAWLRSKLASGQLPIEGRPHKLVVVNLEVVTLPRMSRGQKTLPSFNTVLLYQDLNFGHRAWDFYEKLNCKFARDFEFNHLMWSFSILSEPETFELAERSAAEAHLLVLSFAGTHLPRAIKDWIERWVRIAKHKPALVTLTDQRASGKAGTATHAYLEKILGSHGIDFFPHGASASRVLHLE